MFGRFDAKMAATGGRAADFRPARTAFALAFLALSLLVGCAREPKDAVISLKHWSMDLSQVQAEYNRVHAKEGVDPFSALSNADRVDFAKTLADREILVRQARKEIPRLEGKQARQYRVNYERELQQSYLRWRRESFHLPPDVLAKQLLLVSRTAKAQLLPLPSLKAMTDVEGYQKDGLTFDQIVQKVSADVPEKFKIVKKVSSDAPEKVKGRIPPGTAVDYEVRVGKPGVPPAVIDHVLLRDVPAGGMTPPFLTANGPTMLHVQEFTPIPEASDTAFVRDARETLESIAYMGVYKAWSDSLRQAAGFAFHPESYPIIQKEFEAFWDSVKAVQAQKIHVEFQAMRAPIWRFSADERKQPLYDMWGKTHTVEDFVLGLDGTDLDHWPSIGTAEKIKFQIEARLERLLFQQQAEKTGFPQMPEFVPKAKRWEDEEYLDRYYEILGSRIPAVTDQDMKALYDKGPDSFQSPEKLSFCAFTWRVGKEARAKAVLAKVRQADSSGTFAIALAEHLADSTFNYQPPTKLLEVQRPAPVQQWSDFMQVARGLQAGQTSETFSNGRTVSFVKVVNRIPARTLSFDEAKSMLEPLVVESKKSTLLDSILKKERKSQHLLVHPERLGQPKPGA